MSAIGDRRKEALAEVYRRHGGVVWAVASRVCGSPAPAEQVCERVFTDLWTEPERFDSGRVSLRSWLVARAHAGAMEIARSEPTRQPPPSAEVEVAEHVATLAGPAREAVDKLAATERDAVLLTYLGGHSCGETARLLGSQEATVKGRIRQGLENLRQASGTREVTP